MFAYLLVPSFFPLLQIEPKHFTFAKLLPGEDLGEARGSQLVLSRFQKPCLLQNYRTIGFSSVQRFVSPEGTEVFSKHVSHHWPSLLFFKAKAAILFTLSLE